MDLRDELVGNRDQLRAALIDKVKQKGLTIRDIAKDIGVRSVRLTAFINGDDGRLDMLLRIMNWVKDD